LVEKGRHAKDSPASVQFRLKSRQLSVEGVNRTWSGSTRGAVAMQRPRPFSCAQRTAPGLGAIAAVTWVGGTQWRHLLHLPLSATMSARWDAELGDRRATGAGEASDTTTDKASRIHPNTPMSAHLHRVCHNLVWQTRLNDQ
jgi:hypothetical protein